mmetsp:Transcript_49428/g.82270  ORF Transcript_49428/g.82270 Transcript_49428/m.82270 type:complete len:302 (+) Transcript_49428:128-1033(+)
MEIFTIDLRPICVVDSQHCDARRVVQCNVVSRRRRRSWLSVGGSSRRHAQFLVHVTLKRLDVSLFEAHVFEIVVGEITVAPAENVCPSILLKLVDKLLQSPRVQQFRVLRLILLLVLFIVVLNLIDLVANLLARMVVGVLVRQILVRVDVLKQARAFIHAMRDFFVLIKQHVVQLDLAHNRFATAGTVQVDEQVAISKRDGGRTVPIFTAQYTAADLWIVFRHRFNHRETSVQLVEIVKNQRTSQYVGHLLMRLRTVLNGVHIKCFIKCALYIFGLRARTLQHFNLLLVALFLHVADELLK